MKLHWQICGHMASEHLHALWPARAVVPGHVQKLCQLVSMESAMCSFVFLDSSGETSLSPVRGRVAQNLLLCGYGIGGLQCPRPGNCFHGRGMEYGPAVTCIIALYCFFMCARGSALSASLQKMPCHVHLPLQHDHVVAIFSCPPLSRLPLCPALLARLLDDRWHLWESHQMPANMPLYLTIFRKSEFPVQSSIFLKSAFC